MTESPDAPTVRVAVGDGRSARVLDRATALAGNQTRIVEAGPTGAPGGPYVYVTVNGRTALHAGVTESSVERLLDACEAGRLPTEDATVVSDGEQPPQPDDGPLAVGKRRVLRGCGWREPTDVPSPVAAEVADAPENAVSTVERVGLRGRGRADIAADEPLTAVWQRARNADGDPVLVVNANDADPEANADRVLCAAATGRLQDAAEAVAAIVGAEDIVVFAPSEDDLVVDRVREVDGWQVATADANFRLGEPTMALEALEGNDRVEARRRPPGPEEWGLYGRPTLVHTPRTLLQLAELWRNPDAFDTDAADPGTRVVSVGGDVVAPATVELPTEMSLGQALSAVEVAASSRDAWTMADARFIVGGRFGGLTDSLDVPAAGPALEAAGLGTAGIVEVFGPNHCVVAAVGERAAFAREENCGRCVPCREGSKQLHEALRDVYDGEFDDGGLRELSRVMRTSSLCAFGEAAARPVRTALDAFEGEFRAHANGECPAGACGGLQ
ncbi:MAG: NADH-quinone oxidoreductase subunit F [Natronomonas sp.]|jgi:NADH-quinone oxidoreductase subunit F|uniref:NADH-ubiquinone oxidoreductase-F iron-sulfur binding region domain-containing protein n=1 Tax=Natronomonas sp. TaxID=2184060 RepID=UPI003989D479